MYNFVASGSVLDVGDFTRWENTLEEGGRGLVELDLRLPVSPAIAAELEYRLKQSGTEYIEDIHVSTHSPLMRIYFRKGFPLLAVIAAAILAMLVLAVMIVGWRIFKEVIPEALQPLVGGLGIAVVLGLGVILVAWRLKK